MFFSHCNGDLASYAAGCTTAARGSPFSLFVNDKSSGCTQEYRHHICRHASLSHSHCPRFIFLWLPLSNSFPPRCAPFTGSRRRLHAVPATAYDLDPQPKGNVVMLAFIRKEASWMDITFVYPSSSGHGGRVLIRRSSGGNPEPDTNIKPIFIGQEPAIRENSTNASCISWILAIETSTDLDVIASAIEYVPEVDWHVADGNLLSSHPFADAARSCYNPEGTLMPGSREKAYACWRSLLKLYIQQDYPGHMKETMTLLNLPPLEYLSHPDDPDLLHISDLVFRSIAGYPLVHWLPSVESCSTSHIAWWCRVLLYEVWEWKRDTSRRELSAGGLHIFAEECLSFRPPLSAAAIGDCVLMLTVECGMPLHYQDLSALNKT